MLKQYVNTVNCECERRIRRALVDMHGRHCFSPRALAGTSGSIEYFHVFIVLCDSLQEIFNIINAIFVRLHKTISRLICWEHESVDMAKPLPDILKDLNIQKMDQMNLRPDLISDSPKKQTSHCNRRSSSEIQISVHSRRDHSIYSHINDTYGRFHQLSHNNSDTCLHNNNIGGSDNFSERHNYNIRDAWRIYVSDPHTVSAPVPNERDRRRLVYTQNSTSSQQFDANRSQCSRKTSSKIFQRNQRYHSVNEPTNHEQALSYQRSVNEPTNHEQALSYQRSVNEPTNHDQALSYQRSRHHRRAECHQMSRDEIDSRSGYAAGGVDVQTQEVYEQCDPEILKEIVRTLRIVGDDLDTKMRNYNEPFHQAVMDALKTNTGQLLLATVKQFNLFGVAIEASLSLLKLLNQ